MALKYALQIFRSDIAVAIDCSSLRQTWVKIMQSQRVPEGVAYADIWQWIFEHACRDGRSRLSLRWTRAHTGDNLFVCQMNRDQFLNHRADSEAKAAARAQYACNGASVDAWRFHVTIQQAWLTRFSKLVGEQHIHEEHNNSEESCGQAEEPLLLQMQKQFPAWDWLTPSEIFDWRRLQPEGPPLQWKHSPADWNRTEDFAVLEMAGRQ